MATETGFKMKQSYTMFKVQYYSFTPYRPMVNLFDSRDDAELFIKAKKESGEMQYMTIKETEIEM